MTIKSLIINNTTKITYNNLRVVEFYQINDKIHLKVTINDIVLLNQIITNEDFARINYEVSFYHNDRILFELDKLRNGNLSYEKRNKKTK